MFYEEVLEFHRPSKFLCQTSGRQNHWLLNVHWGIDENHKDGL
jgi:hypothetical protein